MEHFIKFSRVILIVALIGSVLGRLIFDLITGSFGTGSVGMVFISLFSYGTFITLTTGFILCVIWVLMNLFTFLTRKQAGS
ncbi:MAG: hypothetical protein LBJ35_04675 [Spirochaetaceae bacterium]|jgi:hypothetical protein|nr:hypothetical protein [Spirochaetaceae bacterium]